MNQEVSITKEQVQKEMKYFRRLFPIVRLLDGERLLRRNDGMEAEPVEIDAPETVSYTHLQEMLLEYQEQKVGCYPLLRFKLLEILLLTLRGLIEPENKRPYSTSVQEVLEYVNGNYQDSLTLGTFCEQKHYSVAYISRRFKQETGVTLREYVQNVRIKKSCELLEDSDLRVVEIARRVGYEDIKFFNQIFKRRMQISPREYRKICMNRAADG